MYCSLMQTGTASQSPHNSYVILSDGTLYVYVVVNFSSQVIFTFPLFQLRWHTLPYPKTKIT